MCAASSAEPRHRTWHTLHDGSSLSSELSLRCSWSVESGCEGLAQFLCLTHHFALSLHSHLAALGAIYLVPSCLAAVAASVNVAVCSRKTAKRLEGVTGAEVTRQPKVCRK